MKVAAIQFKATKGDPAGSLRQLMGYAEAAGRVSDVVVLPEMAATGYLFDGPDAIREVAERVDGPTFEAVRTVARSTGAWIVCGFPERDGDRLFNSAMVVDPAGALAFCYRKTLLYVADLSWATPGDSGYRAFDTDAGRFGVGICMDLNDDRFVDWAGAAELSALLLPTNWVEEGADVWDYWAWRMLPTGAPLVAANTWGTETLGDHTTEFSGRSAVIRGRMVLAAAPKRGNGWIESTLA